MKTRLLAAALLLVPSAVFASPLVTMTGKVSVASSGSVRLVHADGSSYEVTGTMREDLEAYAGKTVTVKANDVDATLEVFGFAPGTSSSFVTGRLSLESPDCPPNARCAPKAYVTENGRKILVPVPDSFELHSLDGALVTLRGIIDTSVEEPTLRRKPNTNLMVRGRLDRLPYGMNGQTHTLTFENGQSILVAGKGWADRDGATVWLNGKMDFERISGRPMLVSNIASRPVAAPAVDLALGTAPPPEGSNVPRSSPTKGGAPSSKSREGASGASAGQAR